MSLRSTLRRLPEAKEVLSMVVELPGEWIKNKDNDCYIKFSDNGVTLFESKKHLFLANMDSSPESVKSAIRHMCDFVHVLSTSRIPMNEANIISHDTENVDLSVSIENFLREVDTERFQEKVDEIKADLYDNIYRSVRLRGDEATLSAVCQIVEEVINK